ncbi:MAG: endopeptidase La [Candidatus Dadabacteria bacterium]|nr:endopeptidase La [Candidatus Dadabacteria bacterium]
MSDIKIDDSNKLQIPLLPLRDVVVFPYMIAPLYIGRDKSIKAVNAAMKNKKEIFLVTQKDPKNEDPKENDLFTIGTIATVAQMLKLPDGTVKVLIEGKKRGKLLDFIPKSEYFLVHAQPIEEEEVSDIETEALTRNLLSAFESYVKHNKKIPAESYNNVSSIKEANRLSDSICAYIQLKQDDKQELLEIINPKERLEKLFEKLSEDLEILKVEKRIEQRVKKRMEKAQKEHYLNEQMKAIQDELGEGDDMKSEVQEFEEKLKDKTLPEDVEEKIKKELKKLKLMSPMTPEANVERSYIDWILSLPWGEEKTEDRLDLDDASKILDEDHYGLDKPKERIIEYLAVRKLTNKLKGPILCFVGPPGVGKTSLAKSIARAMDRKFVRISLGGVRDEAEIRGHRRTYIGALPGKIIQGMKKAGTVNPVFLLDEIDKLGSDFRGDPSSALLEALDPEQNKNFNDHYIEVDYDLSKVLFICTANVLHSIPWALQDRMEIIRLPGYTENEKVKILMNFLLPKQLEAHGLKDKKVTVTEGSILKAIRLYTREAGVRTIERELATICRKAAKEIVKNGDDIQVKITPKNLSKFLGIPKYKYGEIEDTDIIGMSTGLAWSEVGGEILNIEVSIVPGKGIFKVTGKLGDVMQESAQAAMSYVRSRTLQLGLERNFYQKVDIHIHVPEGAIPKDGPSAGIAITTAIVSALIKKPVKRDVAMTGEITLRGKVLPIGGLKEKILAAHRARVKTVLIPKDNLKDTTDIPSNILKDVELKLVDHMDEVLNEAIISDTEILNEKIDSSQLDITKTQTHRITHS